MPSDKRIRWFEDILDNIGRIERFAAGFDLQKFVTDERATFAVLHALLIISEAARRLGDSAELLAPGQPWRDIRGLGNILRHEYAGVDLNAIWTIVTDDLPGLKLAANLALKKLSSEEAG